VIICTQDRLSLFGGVMGGNMHVNDAALSCSFGCSFLLIPPCGWQKSGALRAWGRELQ
jgi:hypothetical protein